MGSICGKPVPPTDSRMIGKWGSDYRVNQWNVGYGVYRVKRAAIPFMKKKKKKKKTAAEATTIDDRARIEIKPSGWISYVRVSSSEMKVLVLDMPATSWSQGCATIACHSALQYALLSDDCLLVDGIKLIRLE
jgi:hypothetical protein